MFERTTGAATLRFRPDGPRQYAILLRGKEGAGGADLTASINNAFAWMFINTDALVLRGVIRADNRQCLALVPHVPGSRLKRGKAYHTFVLTLAAWAKAYGVENALKEMRSAGQMEKADRLEAAAKAAGVL